MYKDKEKQREYRRQHAEKAKKHKEAYRDGWLLWLSKQGYKITVKYKVLYHHRDPDTKAYSIGSFIQSHSITPKNEALLMTEIAKCIPLTASQHCKTHKPHINSPSHKGK